MIPVTKPFLPPRDEYEALVRGIWERNWLTNHGPLVERLERELSQYLESRHVLFVTNGTIALQLAIRALGLKGEVITTPFSYVATTSSLVWEACQPVFVDIDLKTCNMDPARIVAAITPRTTAIMATHVYGNPCDVESIQSIAKQHRLKVIYDGAHSFGVRYKGESIFSFGDISTGSFHATKLFHTVEGGAVATQDPELIRKVSYLRNFGHDGTEKFQGLGINGKNSEFHAAMGICILPFMKEIMAKRKELSEHYDTYLPVIKARKPFRNVEVEYNYAYYPLIFESEELLRSVVEILNRNSIFPRRYFYPSLDTLPYLSTGRALLHARDVASKVLCLPLFVGLEKAQIDQIMSLVQEVQKNAS